MLLYLVPLGALSPMMTRRAATGMMTSSQRRRPRCESSSRNSMTVAFSEFRRGRIADRRGDNSTSAPDSGSPRQAGAPAALRMSRWAGATEPIRCSCSARPGPGPRCSIAAPRCTPAPHGSPTTSADSPAGAGRRAQPGDRGIPGLDVLLRGSPGGRRGHYTPRPGPGCRTGGRSRWRANHCSPRAWPSPAWGQRIRPRPRRRPSRPHRPDDRRGRRTSVLSKRIAHNRRILSSMRLAGRALLLSSRVTAGPCLDSLVRVDWWPRTELGGGGVRRPAGGLVADGAGRPRSRRPPLARGVGRDRGGLRAYPRPRFPDGKTLSRLRDQRWPKPRDCLSRSARGGLAACLCRD